MSILFLWITRTVFRRTRISTRKLANKNNISQISSRINYGSFKEAEAKTAARNLRLENTEPYVRSDVTQNLISDVITALNEQ